ncbi:MAG: S8 family peptidase [Reichenbachiella sp.]|uniref:S8 family peptidase n=1 Tax=Reichenbachiella sp. TaxID=2184521 RepID=UPI0032996BBE
MLRINRVFFFLVALFCSLFIVVVYPSYGKVGKCVRSNFSVELRINSIQDSVKIRRVKGRNPGAKSFKTIAKPQFRIKENSNVSTALKQGIIIQPEVYQTLKNKNDITYTVIVRNVDHFLEYLNSRTFEGEIKAINSQTNALILDCAGRTLEATVLTYPHLAYIGLSQVIPKVENSINYMDLSVNRINAVHAAYPGLKGEHIQVSIKEQFLDTTDIDLVGRYFSVGLESEIISQHANFMATMIAGAGNTYHLGFGVAPFANITSSDFTSIFPDENELLIANEISIQNHSYGFEIDNRYSPEAQAFDHQSFQLPNVLDVMSAGNKGIETSGEGTYADIESYANLSGSQKMAKNGLIVGATNRFGVRDERSSAGPTFDGRVKPDLMAFGQEGSSDAAALVSGASVLIQDGYQQKYDDLPPSSLVKAVLIAGAKPYTDPMSFKTGYGQLNALAAVKIFNSEQFITGEVQKNDPSEFEIVLPENFKELKMVLCWTDEAGIAGSDLALVNDLDLAIMDPNDQEWLPWVLDYSPNFESLSNPPMRGKDARNNVELISIENPQAGTYSIHVSTDTEMDFAQQFSLAYQITDEDSFQWTFPSSSDICLTNEELIFRWDGKFIGTGRLELKNGAGEWDILDENVDLNDSYFSWTTDTPYFQSQLKMTIGARSFLSGEFNIVNETALNVDYDCEDKFKLIWEKDELAIAYELYELGNKAMVSIASVSDTFYLASKSMDQTLNFAVKPIYEFDANYKSRTIDFSEQGVNCYYTNFISELIDDSFVKNNLSLTSISDIEQVDFYNRKDGVNHLLSSLNVDINADLEVEDLDPWEGVNNYYAQINLKSGEEIQTDTTSIYYTEENTLIVFPNPIAKSSFLNVLTGKPGATLQLLNTSGDLLYEEEVFFDFAQIPIADLAEGIYILRLYQGSNQISQAKLMVTD